MRATLLTLRWSLMLALLLSAFAAQAQTTQPALPAPLPPRPVTSYTVGMLSNDFTYINADTTFVYDFTSSSQALVISGGTSYLMLAYGTQSADTLRLRPELSTIQAAVGLGGESVLFHEFFGLPARVFIPTQLQLDYRYISPGKMDFGSDPDAAIDPDDEDDGPDVLHLASAALAIGGGAEVRLPKLIPVLEDRLVARAALLLGAGARTNVLTEFDELGLMGTRELHLEARLERILGKKTGVTLGYVFRQQNWAQGTPESAEDVLDAFLQPGKLDQKSTQHLIRIGLNF